ncbi:MAG TPA: hypothetical protein VKA95_04725 [Nitrososphaeraceae archaeon]|nr:hypothetical protein [Nitrososphaeraceae archaeon]
MITSEIIISYWKIGFKLVPLDELSKSPLIPWGAIYDNPDFWSIEKIREYTDKFYNVATTFGKSHVKDTQGKELYLYCLDIDSDEVLKRVQVLLEQEWKHKTFVTKTQKDCGYHVYWFEYNSENSPLVTEDCRKGYEFEIKCGKSLCTLPPSQHRDNPLFHYENVGQSDKVMIADGLYEKLVNELLADCFRRKKNLKSKKHNTIKKGSNKSASEPSITSQEEDEVRGVVTPPNNKLDHYITNSSAMTKEIVLTDEQIQISTRYLLPYYHEGSRDKFAFGFSGLTYKKNIAEESAAKILESICSKRDDPEKDVRIDTLHRTFVNGRENGSDAITGKTKLKEVICHVSNCGDDKAAEDVIQGLLEIWHGEKAKDGKHLEYSCNDKNKNDNNNNKQSSTTGSLLLDELVAAGVHNPAEYVINTINKMVKLDDSLVRAVFYAGCSTWTPDPLNIGISAPTSEGKTYTVLQVLQYFPKRDLKYVGSMSPKVIIRQESTLVDAFTLKPVKEDIVTLQKQIKIEENEKRKQELEEQLEDLRANARPFIDLRGKIYVFLEPPSPELWNIIKPIMSHDTFLIEHPYVETNSLDGIHVKSIITLGYPTFIFCTAKDESRWDQWDEIVSRSIVLSPNMSPKKYREATLLNAQLIGLPTAMQESLIVSRREMELARKCVLYLREFMNQSATVHNTNYSENTNDIKYDNPVWIPYVEILGKTLPAERGTEMRINRHIMVLLKTIALAKADLRYQVIFDNQTLTIASVEDLTEALYIMQNSSGLPPYKVKFFNEYIYPLYQKKLEEKLKEQREDIASSIIETETEPQIHLQLSPSAPQNKTTLSPGNSVTLTANEICDYYKLQNPKLPINSDNLRKTYLNELNSAGYIEALDVREGNTKKVYYPIVIPSEEAIHIDVSKETKDSNNVPQFYTYYKINVPINYIHEPENWLILQILTLWKCGIDIGKGRYSIDNYNSAIQFLDIIKKDDRIEDNNSTSTNGTSSTNRKRNKITMRQFAEKYDGIATETLSRHFSKPIFSNYHNKIFGHLQYLGIRQYTNVKDSGNIPNSLDSSVRDKR